MTKKSSYRTIAEAISLGGLKGVKLPTGRVDHRRLSVDEIKNYLIEAAKKAKKTEIELQEPEKGWGDAELSKHIDWVKKLEMTEVFGVKGKKKDKKKGK